jgi:hypothetical protein
VRRLINSKRRPSCHKRRPNCAGGGCCQEEAELICHKRGYHKICCKRTRRHPLERVRMKCLNEEGGVFIYTKG